MRDVGCEQTTAAKWKVDMHKGEMRSMLAANNRTAVGLLIGQALERKRQPCHSNTREKQRPEGVGLIAAIDIFNR